MTASELTQATRVEIEELEIQISTVQSGIREGEKRLQELRWRVEAKQRHVVRILSDAIDNARESMR